jgi:hypothetical protein
MSRSKYNMRMAMSLETYNKISNDCVKRFLEDNPEFKNVKITQNFILNRISDFYLKD